MKKLIVLTGLLIGLSGSAQKTMFQLGPSIGFGHSYLTPYSDVEFQPHWSAGMHGLFTPSSWWGIGADIRYSSEGGKFRAADPRLGTQDVRLDYIRVPIKGYVMFLNEMSIVRPKFGIGPSFGFLVREAGTGTLPAEKFDLGVNASAGLNIMLNDDMCLMFDLNYYQGAIEVRPAGTEQEFNGNFGLNAGVTFAIPGRYTTGGRMFGIRR